MAKPKKNVTGEIYGRLTITGDAPYRSKDRRVYVQCICGNTKDVLLGDLRRGDTQSCGCYLQEQITKHGDAHARLYKIYHGMLNRCYLKTTIHFHNYGGRGITVCDEWKENYEVFRNWALNNGYQDNLTIDRKNVNGNYEPENCQWLSQHLQQRNKQAVPNCSSKYVGVSRCKGTNFWLSYVKINRKMKSLGRFPSELEAAKTRDQYILNNNLEHFRLNNVL